MKTKLVTIKNNIVRLVKNLVAKCKSIKLKRNRPRYFIVSYISLCDSYTGVGTADITSLDGSYINLKILREQIKKDCDQIRDIVVTNIIELNKKDFKQYYFNYK